MQNINSNIFQRHLKLQMFYFNLLVIHQEILWRLWPSAMWPGDTLIITKIGKNDFPLYFFKNSSLFNINQMSLYLHKPALGFLLFLQGFIPSQNTFIDIFHQIKLSRSECFWCYHKFTISQMQMCFVLINIFIEKHILTLIYSK